MKYERGDHELDCRDQIVGSPIAISASEAKEACVTLVQKTRGQRNPGIAHIVEENPREHESVIFSRDQCPLR